MDLRSYSSWAVDLANTWDPFRPEPEGLPDVAALRTFLTEQAGWWKSAGAEDLARLIDLRARIREVFFAPDPHTAVDLLNDLLRTVRVIPQVSGHDDQDWHLHLYDGTATAAEAFAAGALMGLATEVSEIGPERLGHCSLDECVDVYVDTSKNRSRRYCSDGCSNRANVRAHRARRAAAGTDTGAPRTAGSVPKT